MNSYNVFKDYNGYLGLDINDGEVNISEDLYYKNKVLTETFTLKFPNKEAHTILKENLDVILDSLSGEEFARIEDILEHDIGIRLYGTIPYDYEQRKKLYLLLFLELFDMMDETSFYTMDINNQIKILSQFLSKYGFILPTKDKDIMERIVNNILNWYIGGE